MNDRPEPPSYAIGACLNCRHIYLLTPSQRDCPLCMGPPRLWAPFAGVERRQPAPSLVEVEGVEEVEKITVHDLECPACAMRLMAVMEGQGITLALEEMEEAAAVAAEAAGEQQPEEAAPAVPAFCPHQVETTEWCQLCYLELSPKELDAMGRTVEAAQKRLAAEAAQPSDPGLAEDVQRLGVEVEELAEKMPDDVAETQPAEDVVRVPATDHDVP